MFKKLEWNVLIFITVGLMISLTIVSSVSVRTSQNVIVEQMTKDLIITSETISKNIDRPMFELRIAQESNLAEELLRDDLIAFKEITNSSKVYAVQKKGDKYYYVVEGTSSNNDDHIAFGEEVKNPSKALIAAFDTKETQITESNLEVMSAYSQIKNNSGEILGVVGVDMDMSDAKAGILKIVWIIALTSLGALLTIETVNVLSIRRSVRFINASKDNLSKISEGNLDVKQVSIKSKDETKVLADTVNSLHSDLKEFIYTLKESAIALNEKHKELGDIVSTGQAETEELSALTNQTKEKATKQKDLVYESQKQIEEVLNSVNETMNFLELLSEMTKQSLNYNDESLQSLSGLKGKMDNLDVAVNNSHEKIEELEGHVQKIDDMLVLIKEISGRTDILSLNAQIEAARAGDAGKGFAVVAQEVARLSTETKASVSKIEGFVAAINKSSVHVLQSMDEALQVSQSSKLELDNVSKSIHVLKASNHELAIQATDVKSNAESIKDKSQQALENIQYIETLSDEIVTEMKELHYVCENQNREYENIVKTAEDVEHVSQDINAIASKYIVPKK